MIRKSSFLLIIAFLINSGLQAQWTKTNGPAIYRSTDYGLTFSLAVALLDIETVKEGGS